METVYDNSVWSVSLSSEENIVTNGKPQDYDNGNKQIYKIIPLMIIRKHLSFYKKITYLFFDFQYSQ